MDLVTLEDKYLQTAERAYLTGSQALVRLPLMQRWRDQAAGINAAGFISGYRGSPLGIYDLALWQAGEHLKANHIHFEPGVNEDLAATSVWGSQQVSLFGKAHYDGVFALWYGKGPGVDRSGDALKHGNYAGAAANGGVLVLCGDDHAARSSTVPHQSDHALIHFGMPILNPANVQEYLDLGLYGIALSRYSGCWVGFKCVTDTVESSASVDVRLQRVQIRLPEDYTLPEGGLNIRLGVWPLSAEEQLFEQRLQAAQAFVRANGLDGVRFGTNGPARLGIVTTGKAYLDVLEALRRLDINQARAEALGIAVYKVAMVWPLEPVVISRFAENCEELLVVEEKRPLIEEQLASLLYNLSRRPSLVGKQDLAGRPLISSVGELDPDSVLQVIAERYLELNDDTRLRECAAALGHAKLPAAGPGQLVRMPSFCAGCPHNTSTRVPEGSTAIGGIGCHGMAVWLPDRNTKTLYHMGGEGAAWIGQAPFMETEHIFQNLGDGTYFHSGLLAIRACVAAKVNITYKILLNGAVAMTGGQPIEGEVFDGSVTAPHVANQVYAEGVGRIALVSAEPEQHRRNQAAYPSGMTIHHRDELDTVQRELREHKGVSVLIYDQACATERRRLRRRGKMEDSTERLLIDPEVCEGCGDCGLQSNCVALEPEETSLGRKRRINQSVCNTDFSCVKGLCPSFISVSGGRLRARTGSTAADDLGRQRLEQLPEPTLPAFDDTFSLIVGGIGGNGVVTVGAILGMAAHLEQRSCTVLDMSGLAQRNGAVTSHVRLAASAEYTHAARVPKGSADLVIGCDPVVAVSQEVLSTMSPSTAVVLNRFVAPTSGFATNPDMDFGGDRLEQTIRSSADTERVFAIEATDVATTILANAIGANLMLVGYAWQKGLIPLSRSSLERAIQLNGIAVELNQRAFDMGRIAAVHPEQMQAWLGVMPSAEAPAEATLAELVSERSELLRSYQNEAYAERYQQFVEKVRCAEESRVPDNEALTKAVARGLARLMAYKDEYEVARLFSRPDFKRQLEETFEGDYRIAFNLAPPLLSRRDPKTGRPRKRRFGPWVLPVFKVMSWLRVLRGTPLDIFGYHAHRKLERQLICDYERMIEGLLPNLTVTNHAYAVSLAGLADKIRGYDVVKEENLKQVRAQQQELLEQFRSNAGAESSPTAMPPTATIN